MPKKSQGDELEAFGQEKVESPNKGHVHMEEGPAQTGTPLIEIDGLFETEHQVAEPIRLEDAPPDKPLVRIRFRQNRAVKGVGKEGEIVELSPEAAARIVRSGYAEYIA
jgi:hypothetical protein